MSAHEKRARVRFFPLPRSHLHTSRYLLISTTFCFCSARSQTRVSVLMCVCGLEYNPESPARAAQKWSIHSVLKEETRGARDTNFLRGVPVQQTHSTTERLRLDSRVSLDSNYYICMNQRWAVTYCALATSERRTCCWLATVRTTDQSRNCPPVQKANLSWTNKLRRFAIYWRKREKNSTKQIVVIYSSNHLSLTQLRTIGL